MTATAYLLLASALAAFTVAVGVVTLWEPVGKASRERLDKYLEFLDNELKALFRPYRGAGFLPHRGPLGVLPRNSA